MKTIAIYRESNGEFLREIGAQDEELLEIQVGTGERGLFGVENPGGYFLSEAGVLVEIPHRPSVNHVFDHAEKQWLDPRTLSDLKAEKWQEIKQCREVAEFGGFDWDGSRFDSDAMSQSRIQGAVQLAAMAPVFVIEWTLADNSVRTLDAPGMAAVGAALGSHVAAQHTQARSLRMEIDAATNAAQLEKINWSIV